MSENNVDELTSNENDTLFGIPDTGVSVYWDFSAGCAPNGRKGTHLKPVTPKSNKFSSSSSRVYRRRCLTNQIKLPTDGDAEFAQQMLSLVSVNRKSIIKKSPVVSPMRRSPRTFRSKIGKPSPLRDDNFLFLLNDPIENDDMIRCSQITEAALKAEEMKSPLLPKAEVRVNSAKRSVGKNVHSPLSRKRLIDVLPASPEVSPLRQSNNLPSQASTAKVETAKDTDQCNNKVGSAFGVADDELFMNFLDDFSRSEKSELPKRSPRLSISQRRPQSVPGVTPIVRVNTEAITAPAKIVDTDTRKQNDPIVNVIAASEDLDDGLDFDLELSPHLLDLLDGHVDESVGQPSKENVPSRTVETVVQPRLSITSGRPNRIQAQSDQPSKQNVPLRTVESAIQPRPSITTGRPIQANSEPLKSSVPKQASTTARLSSATSSFVPQKTRGVTLSQSVRPTVEKPALVSKGLTRHASAPGLGRSPLSLPPVKTNLPTVQNKASVRRCTPEEIERKRQEALKKLKKSQSK